MISAAAIRNRKVFQWAIGYAAVAWAGLQGLEFLTDTYGWSTLILRIAPVLLVTGLFIVLALAWYHAERGRQRVSLSESLLLATILLAGGVSAYFVGNADASKTPRVDSAQALAVLPFANLSSDQKDAYFASGIHGELLTQLAQLGGLRVISRTSVLAYSDTRKTLKQIGQELGVGAVLEGSVQRAGNRVRVEAQLIDVDSDTHLWADRYDRDVTDVFSIQTDIAQQIATALHAKLTRSERAMLDRRPTANTEAYDAYLRALDYANRPTVIFSDLTTAQRLFERALALDANFAEAHARLSVVHGYIRRWGYDRSAQRLQLQHVAARRALERQPRLPDAHFAMGIYHYFGREDFDLALQEFKEAVRLAPSNSQFVRFIGLIYRRQGRWPDALEYLERARLLNPRDPIAWADLGETQMVMRRYSDAVHSKTRALELAPEFYDEASAKAWLFVSWRGEFDSLRAVTKQTTYSASNVTSGAFDRFLLARWERDGKKALSAALAADSIIDNYNEYYPRPLLVGWAYRLMADTARARAAFDSARVVLEGALRSNPEDIRVHTALGHALAGLGRRSDAERETQQVLTLTKRTRDVYGSLAHFQKAAEIRATVGDATGALAIINDLLGRPSYLDVNNLRLNPVWDPIRPDPRFQALLRKH